ncbi:type II toxin-antitoxin system HicB family antitoxin [Phyllobacterium zundukense]|uniref:CopG family transcriptional regulator n=1 Tax=Phyllobacterium zundukense TaxID=1867719 RepID=A0A2N9VRQ9_9HYPH|nr:type II toxin-antitoxin system HicB family antitoxin [Phyllobacterium zundukense]ATU92601.1 CopG family transcriptional regulator [Phyllobacterium zundukense]PIO42177.1 CopG family transcriptional regulator [Phyllobacterium zundukense]
MRHYFALVHKDDDSAYGMQFPDFPGVYSAADSQDEIIFNAIEALRLYAEDSELSAPLELETVLEQNGVREQLAAGAYLVSVPLIDNDTATVRVNVSFERGVLRAIDDTAGKRGLTRAAFLASAAKQAIEA